MSSASSCPFGSMKRKDLNSKPQAQQQHSVTKILGNTMGFKSIETIPLEIMDEIFLFACLEDADLGLLLTSRSTRWKLRDHIVVQVLQALLPREEAAMIFRGFHRHGTTSSNSKGWILECDDVRVRELQRRIGGASWCTMEFVRRIHVALIKRVLKEYWYPLVVRDGIFETSNCAMNAEVWAHLDRLNECQNATADGWVKAEKVEMCNDLDNGRFPWVKVSLWPASGRVKIRDQLNNKTTEFVVPLLEKFMELKGIPRCQEG